MFIWLTIAFMVFLQSALISRKLVPFFRDRAVSLGMMDKPTLERKQHSRPIPRNGGIGIYIAFWVCLWTNFILAVLIVPSLPFLPDSIRHLAANGWQKYELLEALFLSSTIIFSLGLLDDRYSLSPVVRLFVQILACLPLLYAGVYLKLFLPLWLAYPLTIFWLLFLTNSLNFLDNMNGLTSGVSVIICLVMTLHAFLSAEWYMLLIYGLLGGSVLGFWFFNFPKASVFLGDCGSTMIGFLLGALTILTTYYQAGVPSKLPILIPLVVLGVPIFDTISVMLIRWKAGKPFMEGDTNHISHRLVALGMGQKEAVLFLYVATLVTGLSAIPLRYMETSIGWVQALLIFLIFFLLHWLERVSYRQKGRS